MHILVIKDIGYMYMYMYVVLIVRDDFNLQARKRQNERNLDICYVKLISVIIIIVNFCFTL